MKGPAVVIDKEQLRKSGLHWNQVFVRVLQSMIVGLCVLLLGLSGKTIADEVKTRTAVLDEIFGDQVIAANVRAVRKQAAAMPPAERFNFLLRSILPTPDTGVFRMAGNSVRRTLHLWLESGPERAPPWAEKWFRLSTIFWTFPGNQGDLSNCAIVSNRSGRRRTSFSSGRGQRCSCSSIWI